MQATRPGQRIFDRRRIIAPAVLLVAALQSGCAAFEDILADLRGRDAAEPVVPLEARQPVDAIDPNRFILSSPEQTVIGVPQVVFASETDTLSDLAREYGLGYDEIVEANPDVNPWLPGVGTPILLPTQYVLPDVPRSGIVLNIASKRLFYYPSIGEGLPQYVLTYPIGIGRVGWETPLGETEVVSKAVNPSWFVPASVRREHAEMGDPLPSVVPPGPDNPLGTRVLKLAMPGYLIHGTNQPYGVGMRVSHGCIRLYPENVEFLYELVDVGVSVRIINEPYLVGRLDERWLLEAHAPLEDDETDPRERLDALIAATGLADHGALVERARAIATEAGGMPTILAGDDVVARATVVHNTVEPDPSSPSLEEVREMIDEAVAEAQAEENEQSDTVEASN